MLVAGVYLKPNETLQSPTNATIMARLLALTEASVRPFVLFGDWQNPPSAMSSMVLNSKFHFEILAPDISVLSGNVTKASVLAEFFFALAIGSGMSCVP